MRCICIALVIICFGVAARAEAAAEHLPLVVVENTSLSEKQPDLPLATVGTLDHEVLPDLPDQPQVYTSGDQPRWYTFPETNHEAIDAVAAGKINFSGPLARRTVVFLTAPFLNIRQSWIPNAITIQDKTVTLEVTAWDGNVEFSEAKNFSCRAAYLISLAALPQGDYVLHIHCTHLAQQSDGRYRPSQSDDASTAFTISAAGAKKSVPATIALSALKSAPIHREDLLPEFVPPIHWARADCPAASIPSFFQVGVLDAYKVMDKYRNGDHLPPPHLQISATGKYSGENLVALINPRIQSGDFIALHSIEFFGQDIVIDAEYWQDTTPRAAVVPQSPLLVIPLTFIPKGSHKITLDWCTCQSTFYLINSGGRSPYVESTPTGPFKSIADPIRIE